MLDYRELLTRPFEFVADRLGPVDVTAIVCDADVRVTEVRRPNRVVPVEYDFGRAALASNKPLKGYRQDNGIFLKKPSRHDLRRHADALGQWIRNGARYWKIDTEHDESYKKMEEELFCLKEDYAFVPSNKAKKSIEPDYPLLFIQEDAILAHEIGHAWMDKHTGKDAPWIHPDSRVASETVCTLLDLSYLSEVHHRSLRRRIRFLESKRRLGGAYEVVCALPVHPPTIREEFHGPAAHEALEIWNAGRTEETFARLRLGI